MRKKFVLLLIVFFIPLETAWAQPVRLPQRVSRQSTASDPYATNRILVKFKAGHSKQDLEKAVAVREKERETLGGRIAQKVRDTLLIPGQKTPEERHANISELELKAGVRLAPLIASRPEFTVAKSYRNIDIVQTVEAFKASPEVETAEPDYALNVLFEPNDYYFQARDLNTNDRYQWGIDRVSLPSAWDVTRGNSTGEVIIAIVDTGVATGHQDLSSKVIASFDCASQSACVSGGTDSYGHGTMVAGVAAAATNNGAGMAGAGFNTKLVSVQVMNSQNEVYSSYIYVALNHLVSQYAGKKVVVNFSIGSTAYSSFVEKAVNNAWDAGFLLVGAAGNDNNSTRYYPADLARVLTVAASNRLDTKSSYSNYGNWVEVVVPGGDCALSSFDCMIVTTIGTSSYGWSDGTTFASPMAAGIAALVWAAHPEYTNAQVRTRLELTADPIEGTGSYWKYGRLNAYKAVTYLTDVSIPAPTAVSQAPLGYVQINLPLISMAVGGNPAALSALAYDTLNQPIWSGVSYEWGISSSGSIGSVNPANSNVASFTALNPGTGDLFVTARTASASATKSIPVTVVQPNIPTPTLNMGDANGDGDVNLTDLIALLSNYGNSGGGIGTAQGDLNGDGSVNLKDLILLLSYYGK